MSIWRLGLWVVVVCVSWLSVIFVLFDYLKTGQAQELSASTYDSFSVPSKVIRFLPDLI